MKLRLKNDARYVYGIVDPRTDKIRYVGQAKNPAKRHQLTPRQLVIDISRVLIWEIIQAGLQPKIVILETTTYSQRFVRERYWIGKLKEDLVNVCGTRQKTQSHGKSKMINGRPFGLPSTTFLRKMDPESLRLSKQFRVEVNGPELLLLRKRKAPNLTRAQAARECEMDCQILCLYENSKTKAHLHHISALAKYYGVPATQFTDQNSFDLVRDKMANVCKILDIEIDGLTIPNGNNS